MIATRRAIGRSLGRRGFTLLETVVALAVGGIVVAGSAALVSAVADAEARVREVARAEVRVANAERILVELAAGLIPTSDAEPPLVGSPQELRFDTACIESGGWSRPCTVTWSIAERGTAEPVSSTLLVERGPSWMGGASTRVELALGWAPVAFSFLVSANGGGSWSSSWTSIVPPLAIGIHGARDTLLLPIEVAR
ncbi:MAG: prepilin-type N-terminal cleavage/methylation domain-containing protein [Gemmatimonadetes bacterium]|nr:prepilin-type N-terminal cleavage/methylation domain-containing protein [Gemmatimonadota bacterium]